MKRNPFVPDGNSAFPSIEDSYTRRHRNATHHGSQMPFKSNLISFVCHGTLINFEMGPAADRLFKGVSRLKDVRQLPGLLGL